MITCDPKKRHSYRNTHMQELNSARCSLVELKAKIRREQTVHRQAKVTASHGLIGFTGVKFKLIGRNTRCVSIVYLKSSHTGRIMRIYRPSCNDVEVLGPLVRN